MEKIKVNIAGKPSEIYVLRYYTINECKYLLFTNETLEKDSIKIFVSKIYGNNVVEISSDSEWNNIKKDIVELVNDNKELSKLNIIDLSTDDIKNIDILSARALVLPTSVIEYITANRPKFNEIVRENDYSINYISNLDSKVDDLKKINSELSDIMNEMENDFSSNDKMEVIMPSNGIVEENKVVSEKIESSSNITSRNDEENFKKKYLELFDENEVLKNRLNKLELELNELNNKINLIKNVLE